MTVFMDTLRLAVLSTRILKPHRPLAVPLPFFAFQLVSSLFDDIPEIRTHLEKIHLDAGIMDHLTWIDKEVIAFYFK